MRFLVSAFLTAVAISSFGAHADYLMEIRDINGAVIDSQCVKSYSYSNNSASIQHPKIRKEQKYSYDETLTNINYLGRPVYRRVIAVDGVYDRTVGNYPEMDFLVGQVINFRLPNGGDSFAGYSALNYFANITLKSNKDLRIASNFAASWGYVGEVVVEYTKVGDYGASGSDDYKEFVHYSLSSTTDDSVVTKVINENSVSFTGGYSYNSSNATCSN